MAVTTIKGLLAVSAEVDRALTGASDESAGHAAAASSPAPPPPPAPGPGRG